MALWQTLSQKKVFTCPFLKVREDLVLYPSGKKYHYWTLERNDFSLIIPLDKNHNTYLVGQYRHAIKEYSWEFPMGGSEENEKMLVCAQRELSEETGLTAKIWKDFGNFYIALGYSNQKAFIFIAKELTLGKSSPTESEEITLKKIKIEKVYEMAKNGKITDGPTLAALLLLGKYLK